MSDASGFVLESHLESWPPKSNVDGVAPSLWKLYYWAVQHRSDRHYHTTMVSPAAACRVRPSQRFRIGQSGVMHWTGLDRSDRNWIVCWACLDCTFPNSGCRRKVKPGALGRGRCLLDVDFEHSEHFVRPENLVITHTLWSWFWVCGRKSWTVGVKHDVLDI